jgi:hypothetical protein
MIDTKLTNKNNRTSRSEQRKLSDRLLSHRRKSPFGHHDQHNGTSEFLYMLLYMPWFMQSFLVTDMAARPRQNNIQAQMAYYIIIHLDEFASNFHSNNPS